MALDRLSAAALKAVDEYYESCRAAENHKAEETHAAIVLQSAWRGCLQRKEVEKLSHLALTIQRCWRGCLGRQRFAAARAAHNKQLREAYFDKQATTIQRCWRGYYSRSRIHDFYKRKEYLAAVAAANAAVRAGMDAELQEAMQYQQQTAEQLAKQHFDAQVSRLHHLTSTMSIPGIFNPPLVAATPTAAGLPLEQHLKTAAKQQAFDTVRNQQAVLRQTLGSYNQNQRNFQFPAGSIASRQSTASAAGATAAPAVAAASSSPAAVASQWAPGVSNPGSSVRAYANYSNSGAASRGRESPGKLAAMVVAAVDEEFNALADPNMPDGSFNPALTLQQSAGYEAVRQAKELERRINRGLMLTMHNGQPFNARSKPPSQEAPGQAAGALQPSPAAAAALAAEAAAGQLEGRIQQRSVSPGRSGSPGSPQLWKHNKFPGGMFSKHLKQAY
eukprot:GHUV01014584.1.p1 GENE.GHUV01014584.1~~GHUV01014584.1.p1  ORF type:complete len:446 (+),score=179.98 GHUV01014584.1:898-2235(+)